MKPAIGAGNPAFRYRLAPDLPRDIVPSAAGPAAVTFPLG